MPVRVKKTRQNNKLEPGSDSIGTDKALFAQGTAIMSKPVRTEAELIAMAKAELKVHAEPPDGMVISILRSGESWEFRASADAATAAKPGYPEAVAMLMQIGDHLGRQYDLKGQGASLRRLLAKQEL
jgi:hypothetical protein